METAFIKEVIERILRELSVNAKCSGVAELNNGEITKFSIETEEPYLLIGENGRTLMALNHVIKKIFEVQCPKKGLKPLNFIVDVNDYQERRIEELKSKAQIMAERARFFKNDVELIPMNPYERMIVHSLFSDAHDIETESTGVGKNRRVVLKYVQIQ